MPRPYFYFYKKYHKNLKLKRIGSVRIPKKIGSWHRTHDLWILMSDLKKWILTQHPKKLSPGTASISFGSRRRTQENWVLTGDPIRLGPASIPKANGFGGRTQFSWIWCQEPLDGWPKCTGSWWSTQANWVPTQDPRELNPYAGLISLGS